jgi:hypothetical protein
VRLSINCRKCDKQDQQKKDGEKRWRSMNAKVIATDRSRPLKRLKQNSTLKLEIGIKLIKKHMWMTCAHSADTSLQYGLFMPFCDRDV